MRIERVSPFTQKKRRKFRVQDCQEISPTLDERGKQYFPREFKEYFEQNFKNQFFKTERKESQELKESFLAEAGLAFDNEDSDKDGLLSIDQAFLYYFELSRTIYEQQPSRADFDEFWKKEGL